MSKTKSSEHNTNQTYVLNVLDGNYIEEIINAKVCTPGRIKLILTVKFIDYCKF